MEFAMILPAVAMILAAVVLVASVSADLVRVQYLARDAARSAVLDQPVGSVPNAKVSVARPSRGGQITATVKLRSALVSRMGADVWLTGVATMTDEP